MGKEIIMFGNIEIGKRKKNYNSICKKLLWKN